MKKLVHTIPHLADLLASDLTVWVVDNANTFSAESIFASAEDEPSDYSLYSDEELAKLPKSRIDGIRDITTLDRLCSIDRNLLNIEQQNILSEYYKDPKNRIVIDANDVKEVINQLKKSDQVLLTPSLKNRSFARQFKTIDNKTITTQVVKDIINQLKLSDYRYNLKSAKLEYLGNNLIVLQPKHDFILKSWNVVVKDLVIYIKVDLTESDGDSIVVSFHRAEQVDPQVYE